MPDILALNGDIGDFYAISKYDKDPARYKDGGLQEEADAVRRLLRQANAALHRRTRIVPVLGKRKIVMLPGNHEDRVRRWVWAHPEVYGLRALEIPELFGLNELGIEYEPDTLWLANQGLAISHGTKVRQKSGYTAMAELEAVMYGHSTVTNHTHRGGTVYTKTPKGVVSASEGFCLCDTNPTYVKKPNWQQGVSLIYSSLTTTEHYIVGLPFHKDESTGELSCVVEGKRVSV